MAISVCLFTLNHDANLMQVLLGDVTASLSASLEFTRILNRLGITVSNETLKRYRFDVVSKLKDENLKCFLDPDAFSVATVDNVDKGIPHARLKAGQSNYGFHGTSVQSVQAKPISVKNHPEDYIMFTRNLNADENAVFQKVKIFGDGSHCFCVIDIAVESQWIQDFEKEKS